MDKFSNAVKTDEKDREYFIHFVCGRRSYNPNDIRFKYCAVCHTFPDDERKKFQLKKNIKIAEKNIERRAA